MYISEEVECSASVFLKPQTFFGEKQLEFFKHLQFYYRMDRITQLFNQGRLLFVPKTHPKYTDNQLRVFKSSVVLKVALGLSGLYAIYSLFSFFEPQQIVIEYPAQPSEVSR